jgi:transposase
MDILRPCRAGLDLHKETVVARVRQAKGGHVRQEVRTCRAETNALLELADWLTGRGVSHVAMGATGAYWKPAWNLFEGLFELLLVNAEHVKRVPGRKTDVEDARWVAELLRRGLLKPGSVPEKPVRQLRDLTRQRVRLIRRKAQVANRVQKALGDATIKLATLAQ